MEVSSNPLLLGSCNVHCSFTLWNVHDLTWIFLCLSSGKKAFPNATYCVLLFLFTLCLVTHTWTKIWALGLGPDKHSCVISRLLATALQCYLAAISHGKILSSPGLQWKFSPDEIFLSPAPRSNLFMTRYLCHPK